MKMRLIMDGGNRIYFPLRRFECNNIMGNLFKTNDTHFNLAGPRLPPLSSSLTVTVISFGHRRCSSSIDQLSSTLLYICPYVSGA